MNLRWKIAQAIEIRWWQRYLRKKPVEDYLAWKKSYWINFLSSIQIEPKNYDMVLDVGCGPAGVFIVLPNSKVDAVDPLLSNYEMNLSHFDQNRYPNTNFINVPFEGFKANKKYDLIFCLNAINHVNDLESCFQKLGRLLTKNGRLVLSIDAHNHKFFKHLFRMIPGDILHPHQYDLDEYEQKVSELGLNIERTILYKEEFFFNYHIIIAKK